MPDERTKEVRTKIEVSCDGKVVRRFVYENWWKKLSIEEIADTTEKAVKEIV